MIKASTILIAFVLIIALLIGLYFGITPGGRAAWNRWFFGVQKADDATRYSTIKKVEDTCRAMIASYEVDKLMYEQYKDSDSEENYVFTKTAKKKKVGRINSCFCIIKANICIVNLTKLQL